MKTKFAVLYLIISLNAFSQIDFIFPIELHWWIDEFKSVNPDVSIDSFKYVDWGREYNFSNINQDVIWEIPLTELARWNYTGTLVAFTHAGLGDIDTHMGILTRSGKTLYIGSSGSGGIWNAVHWLNDTTLICVGVESFTEDETALIKKISIIDDKVETKVWIYPKITSVDNSRKLKLNWFEHYPEMKDLIAPWL